MNTQGILDRFLRYVTIDTRADIAAGVVPSTAGQATLARLLADELRDLGLENVAVDEHSYVTASLPASPGAAASAPSIGLLAHLDTAMDTSGANVKPRVIRNYDGGDITLASGRVLSSGRFPDLARQKGRTVIVTDGTTLLGGDDKSGIAVVMAVLEKLQNSPEIIHGPVKVALAPDEEIAHGASLLDLRAFGADFAYTVDAMGLGTLEYENFNAAKAAVTVRGALVHPGEAKDRLVNAILLGKEFLDGLPELERPEHTEGRQGFFHVNSFTGAVGEARITMIIRDHDARLFERRKQLVKDLVARLNEAYPSAEGPRFTVELTEQYRNMLERIEPHMHIVETALQAIRDAGLTPLIRPTRGGSDGSQLSWRGLPTPNLFGGFYNAHGPYEFAVLEEMEAAAGVIVRILEAYGMKK